MPETQHKHLQALLDDISRYIDFLKREYGLQITLHHLEVCMPSCMDRVLPYNVHMNPVCMYLKRTPEIWSECIRRQEKTQERACEGPYFGTCWMGMGEFIFPVLRDGQRVAGFVSVSGYQGDPEKKQRQFDKVCARYSINRDMLEDLYARHVRADKPDFQWLQTLISPLCNQFTLLFLYMEEIELRKSQNSTSSEILFTRIKRYLERHYFADISLSELAGHFNCSTSYLSRIIREQAHCNYRSYVNRNRVQIAKAYLENTRLSIQEITYQLSFSDSNYFSTVFRRETGYSPRQWRQMHAAGNTSPEGEADESERET